ncbi:hypothetical protein F2Q68_00029117 [Brassica cretica]|uniref:ABC1 atypical kinase-like domain-containing protein n=1 Tax=Brassica cretica TaxID=69181 RepID=A0A8S9GBU3_BRACR|nr:hypothetical protein F2Q68_00029117 [Brassica cretica]
MESIHCNSFAKPNFSLNHTLRRKHLSVLDRRDDPSRQRRTFSAVRTSNLSVTSAAASTDVSTSTRNASIGNRNPKDAAIMTTGMERVGKSSAALEQLDIERGVCIPFRKYSPETVRSKVLESRGSVVSLASRGVEIVWNLGLYWSTLVYDFLVGRDEEVVPFRARQLRNLLCNLGPSFIKAGQVLANRPDIIREDYMNELCILQDDVPPFPNEVAFKIIEEELGQPLESLFSKISSQTIAAASLGQVYRATLRATGEDVAIKEGICFTLKPDFKFLEVKLHFDSFLQVAYPYVAKRLLTDPNPALRERLIQVLFKDGNFQWKRLENLISLAKENVGQMSSNPALRVKRVESKLDLTDTIKDGARLFLLDEGIRRKLILALTEDSKLHVEELVDVYKLVEEEVDIPTLAMQVVQDLPNVFRDFVLSWSNSVLSDR